jgi:hypothetical protein
VIRSSRHEGPNVGLKFQIGLVAYGKMALYPLFICLRLHALLSPIEVLAHQCIHDDPFIQPRLQLRMLANCSFSDSQMARFSAIEHLEWSLTQGGVIASVVPKFRQGKPLTPFLQAGMNKAVEVCFEALVDPFSLPISLRMVSRAHPKLSSSQFEQFLPYFTGEDGILVRDHGLEHSMQAVDLIQEGHNHLRCDKRTEYWHKIRVARELVDYD